MNAVRARALEVVAVAAVALGTLDLNQHYGLGPVAAFALSLLRAAPLALARRRPLTAWAGVLVTAVVTAVPAEPVGPDEPWPWPVTSLLAALAVLAVLGSRLRPPALVAAWASMPAVGALLLLVAPERGGWSGLVPVAVLGAVALGGGYLVRGRAEARRSLDEQVLRTEGERAGREVLRERARLARELHDVIAHGLSVVTVRADSAPHRVAGVSPAAAAEFAAIAETARSALTELRQVLGVLRDPEAGPDTAPVPGLADLPALAAAGTGVRLEASGPTGSVPPAVQLTAYRQVQEALSNARRHAPGSAVTVTVAAGGDALRLSVVNTAGTAPPPAPGRGYGLAGMRERVALLGGTVHADRRPDGGWQVDAVLPLGQEDG